MDEVRVLGKSQVTWSFVNHVKKFEFYSKSNGNKIHECSQLIAFDFQLQGKE